MIAQAVGYSIQTFDGFEVKTGFVVETPHKEIKEVPFEKIGGTTLSKERMSEWQPQYLTVSFKDGEIWHASQKEVRSF